MGGRVGGLGVCGGVETRCFWDFLGLELSNCECEVTLTLTLKGTETCCY